MSIDEVPIRSDRKQTGLPQPAWFSVVVSLIALTVSGLSFWESHLTRALNVETNRAVLMLDRTTSGLTRHSTWNPGDDITLESNVRVKNIGRVTATIQKMVIEHWRMPDSRRGCAVEITSAEQASPMIMHRFGEPTDLPPGTTKELWVRVSLPHACEKAWENSNINLSIDVEYTDAASGKRYKENFLESTRVERDYEYWTDTGEAQKKAGK